MGGVWHDPGRETGLDRQRPACSSSARRFFLSPPSRVFHRLSDTSRPPRRSKFTVSHVPSNVNGFAAVHTGRGSAARHVILDPRGRPRHVDPYCDRMEECRRWEISRRAVLVCLFPGRSAAASDIILTRDLFSFSTARSMAAVNAIRRAPSHDSDDVHAPAAARSLSAGTRRPARSLLSIFYPFQWRRSGRHTDEAIFLMCR